MTQRIVKFKGSAFSTTGNPVHVLCKYNNVTVFDDIVNTVQVGVIPNECPPNSITDLFEFTTTMSLTGSIPVEVIPTGGKLFFTHLDMNYGIARTDMVEGNMIYMMETTYYVPPSFITVESDGILTPTLNGVDYSYFRPIEEAQAWADAHDGVVGPWTWPVAESHVFACDYIIDPNKTMFNQDTKEWGPWPLGVEL